jgi:hypothetical protein
VDASLSPFANAEIKVNNPAPEDTKSTKPPLEYAEQCDRAEATPQGDHIGRARRPRAHRARAQIEEAIPPSGSQPVLPSETKNARKDTRKRSSPTPRGVQKLGREAWCGAGGRPGGSVGAPVVGGCLCSCRSSTLSSAACSRSSCCSRVATARRNSSSLFCAMSCRFCAGGRRARG